MNSSDFKLKQHVEVLIDKPRISGKSFKGEVVYISNHFVTVENKDHIKESFKYVDFNIGKITLKQ